MDETTVNRILDTFEMLFPDAHGELLHRNHFELLIAVMLSAQTTDVAVNKVTPALFDAYPTPEAMAKAEVEQVASYIKSIGLYMTKAKNVVATSHLLVTKHKGQVPSTREALMELPGVGRKTANVVLSIAFGIPALAVDTHVDRVSKRLGITKEKANVLAVEKRLMKVFPKDKWNKLHHQMIFFGRYHCTSKRPNCGECPLYDICVYKDKAKYRSEST